jgi:hypothetical protein
MLSQMIVSRDVDPSFSAVLRAAGYSQHPEVPTLWSTSKEGAEIASNHASLVASLEAAGAAAIPFVIMSCQEIFPSSTDRLLFGSEVA